jgi:hypothetical protein
MEANRKTHTHEAVGFNEALKIGILYDATNDKDYETIKQYVKNIRSQQKEILALGYVNEKKLPQNKFAQYGLDFFTRQNFRFNLTPNNVIISNFINEKFDILINAGSNDIFPLRFISATSHARFRVGRFDDKNTFCYEMMIHTPEQTGIKEFLEAAEESLRQIKTK